MDTHILKGNLAEIIVAKQAIKQGGEVALPISGASSYDLVIRAKTKFIAVQVKKAWYNKSRNGWYVEIARNSFNRRTRTQRLQYTSQQIDFLIACNIETEDCWIIPIKYLAKYKSNLSLETRAISQFKNNWSFLR